MKISIKSLTDRRMYAVIDNGVERPYLTQNYHSK